MSITHKHESTKVQTLGALETSNPYARAVPLIDMVMASWVVAPGETDLG